MVLDEWSGDKSSQGLLLIMANLHFMRHTSYFECEVEKKGRFAFLKSNRILLLEPLGSRGLWEELFPYFSTLYLFLLGSGLRKGRRKDTHKSLCAAPPSWSPAFADFSLFFFHPCHLWSVAWRKDQTKHPQRGMPKSFFHFPTRRSVGKLWANS